MTKIILTFVLFLLSVVAFSQEEKKLETKNTFNISVKVNNVVSDKGHVYFSLFNEETFNETPLLTLTTDIDTGKTAGVFKNLKPGIYAIIAFHDSNDNGKIDFSEQGMPLEDYGVSTNKINQFGPPRFNAIKFEVSNKNLSFDIKF